MEMMLEQQGTEEEKRNQKKETGYPNLSTPWKTGPNSNLALESTLYLKLCVFIKETASWISWHISSWMRRWGVASVALRELIFSSFVTETGQIWHFWCRCKCLFFQAPPTTFIAQATPFSTHLFMCGSCTVQQDTPITPTDLLNGGVKEAASNMLYWEGKKKSARSCSMPAC